MPETLPTVTSSTMTGEFCGSVATSGISTVIEYAPLPWPAVPGITREFSPLNWQPASSALPAAKALPRNHIRFIRHRPGQSAVVRWAPGSAEGRAGNRTRSREEVLARDPCWRRRAVGREEGQSAGRSAEAGSADPPGSGQGPADAHLEPVSRSAAESESPPWPGFPAC